MKISACYIVKNEGKKLRKSIESIQEIISELIVVDTGSCDDTVQIARSLGAKVYSYRWRDDFSAARNFALGKAMGDWIIFLDADEYLSQGAAQELKRRIEKNKEQDALLLLRYDIDGSEKNVLGKIWVPRVLRKQEGLAYVGRIHEEPRKNNKVFDKIRYIPPEQASLYHTGYEQAMGKEKAERNLRILLQEEAEGASPAHIYHYLAETYAGLNNRKKAIEYAKKDIALGRQNRTNASSSYRILLGYLAENPALQAERIAVLKEATADFPELPEFYAEYAECLANEKKWQPAVSMMEQALSISTADSIGLEESSFTENLREIGKRHLLKWQQNMTADKIRITACLIVRDGGKDLEKWLENAKIYSDERIVVDTGSTDDSVANAKKAGAVVYEIPWQDDFSAARNFALSKASGDWISFLDADECFDKPETIRQILQEMQDTGKLSRIDGIEVPIRNVDKQENNREFHRFYNIRLLRNSPELRYEGKVHEQLRRRGSLPNVYREERFTICHTGYSQAGMTAKAKRNLQLLEEDNPRHFRYLADTYMTLGDYARAAHFAELTLHTSTHAGDRLDMYWLLCDAAEQQDLAFPDLLATAERAEQEFPNSPDFPARIGCWLWEWGAEDKEMQPLILSKLQRAITLAETAQERSHYESLRLRGEVYALAVAAVLASDSAENAEFSSQLALYFVQNPQEEACYEAIVLADGEKKLLSLAEDKEEAVRKNIMRWAEQTGRIPLYRKLATESQEQADSYADWDKKDCQALEKQAIQSLIGAFPYIIRVLLELEQKEGNNFRALERQTKKLLPPAAEQVWDTYKEGGVCTDYGTFQLLWKEVRFFGTSKQTIAFAQMLAESNPERYRKCAEEIYESGEWQTAFSLYQGISMQYADGSFWEHVGICCYQLGWYDTMQECFAHAREKGTDTLQMKSYEAWSREASV